MLQPTLTPTRDREMELVCARANSWTNQLYTVNINGADPWAVGASAIVDPEGVVRQQAGPGEEILVETLDLDTVTKVRTYGTFGLNRPWDQLARHGADIHLPMYGASFNTPKWHPAEHRRASCSSPHEARSIVPALAVAIALRRPHFAGVAKPPPGVA